MRLVVACLWGAAMVHAWAQNPRKPPELPVATPAVVPTFVPTLNPQRLLGQGAGQTMEQKPAMSVPKTPENKRPPVVQGSPPSLGLCDGS